MAIYDFTGFESGDLAECVGWSGATLIGPDPAASRHGDYAAALELAPGSPGWVALRHAPEAPAHQLGFGIRLDTLPTRRRNIGCFTLPGGSLRLDLTPSGALVLALDAEDLAESGSPALLPGGWRYVELRFAFAGEGPGLVEAAGDGTVRSSASLPAVSGPVTGAYVGSVLGALDGTLSTRLDDLVYEVGSDAAIRGSVGVSRVLRIVGAGAENFWTGSWSALADWPGPNDGDGTFAEGRGAGRFRKASAVGSVPEGEALLAVRVAAVVRNRTSQVPIAVGLGKGGNSIARTYAGGTSYFGADFVAETAALDGGAGWSEALLDTYDVHLFCAADAGNEARCTAAGCFLLHTAPPGVGGAGGGGGEPQPGSGGPGVPLVRLRSDVRRTVQRRCGLE